LEQGKFPVALIIKKNGKELAPFDCLDPPYSDTSGYAINNHDEIVGTCSGRNSIGFVVKPKTGDVSFLAYPGANNTDAYGINDYGNVVGFYANPIQPPFCCNLPVTWLHSFFWGRATGEYKTIDNPSAELGAWTTLIEINNKDQILGYYNDPTFTQVEHPFIYDNGTFTPVEFPGAIGTRIAALNNNSQVLGSYDDPKCHTCLFLYDDGEYFKITLPLPPNAPRPDGVPAGNALLIDLGGMNDKGQFVGTYLRASEWFIASGHLESKSEIQNFIATPEKRSNKNK
jgi:uncharacterized membrane protein